MAKYRDQYAAVGATILNWNEADHLLDTFACLCLQVPEFMWPAFLPWFDSTEAKSAVIRARLKYDLGESHPVFNVVNDLLGRHGAMKRYRDHLAHVAPSFELRVGTTKQKRERKRIPLVLKDLQAVAQHADALVEDMMHAEDVFAMLYGDHLMRVPPTVAPYILGDPKKPPLRQDLQAFQEEAKSRQKTRALSPLPKLWEKPGGV